MLTILSEGIDTIPGFRLYPEYTIISNYLGNPWGKVKDVGPNIFRLPNIKNCWCWSYFLSFVVEILFDLQILAPQQ